VIDSVAAVANGAVNQTGEIVICVVRSLSLGFYSVPQLNWIVSVREWGVRVNATGEPATVAIPKFFAFSVKLKHRHHFHLPDPLVGELALDLLAPAVVLAVQVPGEAGHRYLTFFMVKMRTPSISVAPALIAMRILVLSGLHRARGTTSGSVISNSVVSTMLDSAGHARRGWQPCQPRAVPGRYERAPCDPPVRGATINKKKKLEDDEARIERELWHFTNGCPKGGGKYVIPKSAPLRYLAGGLLRRR
jgi:hypothetical protein